MTYGIAQAAASRVREEAPPYLASPVPPASQDRIASDRLVAGAVLRAFDALDRAEAEVAWREAELWLRAQREQLHHEHGHQNLGDFAREVVGTSPATARRRVRLARVLESSPEAREAFLDGRLGLCQAVLLAPVLGKEADPFWVELAERLSYRELRDRVVEARRHDASVDPHEGAACRFLRFQAPAAVALSWHHAVELGRRVLGFEAPAHACFAAMLAESSGETDNPGRRAEPIRLRKRGTWVSSYATGTARPENPGAWPNTWRPSASCRVRAWETIRLVEREIAGWFRLCDDASSESVVPSLQALQQLDRPLRLLRARLLRDARALDLPAALGYPDLPSFVQHRLRLSERAARDLLAEASVFRSSQPLQAAFVEGRITGAQARSIHRLTLGGDPEPWIDRAEGVTRLQFERESSWILRCHELLPHPGAVRPLPDATLEDRLLAILIEHGWTAERVEAHMNSCDVEVPEDPDPARDPRSLRRLEILLDLCVLEMYPDGVSGEPGLPSETTESGIEPADPAPRSWLRQTLITGGGMVPISLTLPRDVHDQWTSVAARIRSRHGPAPTWAVFGQIVCRAVQEWTCGDPAARPTEHRILERDGYRCTAPGCTSRRNLEAHHIVFRSHRGSDAPGNLTSLCAFHHRHAVHANRAQVRGLAPGTLAWVLGLGTGMPRHYRGHARSASGAP